MRKGTMAVCISSNAPHDAQLTIGARSPALGLKLQQVPILCERTANALARLRRCTGSPETSLFAFVISSLSWTGSNRD